MTKEKVANVLIYSHGGAWYWSIPEIKKANIHTNDSYPDPELTKLGAKKFCKVIGFKCVFEK